MTRKQAVRHRLAGAMGTLAITAGLGLMIGAGVYPYQWANGKHLGAGSLIVIGALCTLLILVGLGLLLGEPDEDDSP